MSVNIYVIDVGIDVGGQQYLLKMTQDITERRRAELAEEAVRVRDNFVSVAAHELKTPLSNLRGHAQRLKRLLERDDAIDVRRLRQGLTAVDRATERLALLVAQMLDITRIEALGR
jgi:two-component system, OmpR family, sensor kinase